MPRIKAQIVHTCILSSARIYIRVMISILLGLFVQLVSARCVRECWVFALGSGLTLTRRLVYFCGRFFTSPWSLSKQTSRGRKLWQSVTGDSDSAAHPLTTHNSSIKRIIYPRDTDLEPALSDAGERRDKPSLCSFCPHSRGAFLLFRFFLALSLSNFISLRGFCIFRLHMHTVVGGALGCGQLFDESKLTYIYHLSYA